MVLSADNCPSSRSWKVTRLGFYPVRTLWIIIVTWLFSSTVSVIFPLYLLYCLWWKHDAVRACSVNCIANVWLWFCCSRSDLYASTVWCRFGKFGYYIVYMFVPLSFGVFQWRWSLSQYCLFVSLKSPWLFEHYKLMAFWLNTEGLSYLHGFYGNFGKCLREAVILGTD